MNKEELLFLDTEFTGLDKNPDLISLALIDKNNRAFYCELNDFDIDKCNPWVRCKVLKKLKFNADLSYFEEKDNITYIKDTKENIYLKLKEWLSYYDNKIRVVVDVNQWDWVLFSDLCKMSSLDDCIDNIRYIPLDLSNLLYFKGIDPDIHRETYINSILPDDMKFTDDKHNCLYDVKILKLCYEKALSEEWA